MAKMTLDDLKRLREDKRRDLEMRDTQNKAVQIIVGMGTSGIANGAKETLQAFLDELEKENLSTVAVRQTGSLGLDHAEPTVEVRTQDMPTVIYGKVDPEVARRIIHTHIVGKQLLEDHIYDRPAPDIVQE